MSDYLAGLAARVLAPSDSMQPRRAARFEPWATPVAAAPGELDTPPAIDRTPEQEPPQATRVGRLAAGGERGSARGQRRTASRNLAAPKPSPPFAEASEPPANVPESHATHGALAGNTEAFAAPSVLQPHSSLDSSDAPAISAGAELRTRVVQGTRTVARERRIPARVIERLRVRHEHDFARETAAAPIEITIGRIDIRAVAGTQPQRPKSKPEPRIGTLEEYAARRGGGRK